MPLNKETKVNIWVFSVRTNFTASSDQCLFFESFLYLDAHSISTAFFLERLQCGSNAIVNVFLLSKALFFYDANKC